MKLFCFLLLLLSNECKTQRSRQYRIIVFDFKVAGDQLKESDGAIVADAIRSSFQNSALDTSVKILEREEIVKLYKDKSNAQKLPGIYDSSSAVKIGRLLQANYVLFGGIAQSSYLFEGTRISARIVGIEEGNVTATSIKTYNDKSKFDIIIAQIASELASKLDIRFPEPPNLVSKSNKLIKDILDGFQKKYDDNDCYGKDHHNAGYYNGIVYYPEYPTYKEHINEIKTISSLNATISVIGIIYDKIYKTNIKDKEFVLPFEDEPLDNMMLFVINEDGIYWKIKIGKNAPCDCDFYNSRKGIQINGGLNWKQLSEASIDIRDTTVQKKVKGRILSGNNTPKEEKSDLILYVNNRLLVGKSEISGSCFNIYEISNLLNQLKNVYKKD